MSAEQWRQLDLFDDEPVGRSHRGDPWTSHAASERFDRRPQRLRVLQELRRARSVGRTDFELGEALGILQHVAGTRRKELEDGGMVARTERTRLTRFGNPALVHVITSAGLAHLKKHDEWQ